MTIKYLHQRVYCRVYKKENKINKSCVKSRVVKYLIRLSTQHNTTKNDLLLHIT